MRQDVLQLLWKAQSFNHWDGLCTAASAHAIYALAAYLLTGKAHEIEGRCVRLRTIRSRFGANVFEVDEWRDLSTSDTSYRT